MSALEIGCAIVGCRLVRRTWDRPYKALVLLAVVTVIVEFGSSLLLLVHITPHDAYIFFTPFETWIILYFLGATQSGRLLRWMHLFFLVSMAVLIPVYFYLPASRAVIFQNLYLQAYFCFMLLLASCGAVIQIVRNTVEEPLSSYPVFWIAMGMLCYSCVYSILNTLGGLLARRNLFAAFTMAANICMYIGFIVGFVRYARQQSTLEGVS